MHPIEELDPNRTYATDELMDYIARWTAELRSGIDTHEENLAVHAPDDGLTTDQRAIAALERPERFRFEHQVARVWLQNSPTAFTFAPKEDEVKDGGVEG